MSMSMLIAQSKVEMLRMSRNVYFVFWSLMIPVAFYVLYTRIFATGTSDAEAWNAHYLMSMTCFSIMGSSIMTLGIRLVQERAHGWSTFLQVTPLPGPSTSPVKWSARPPFIFAPSSSFLPPATSSTA